MAAAIVTLAALAGAADEKPLATWKTICSFRPPRDVQAAVYRRGEEWAVHRIEDARGGLLNLDYYPVRVRQMPTVDGRRLTPQQLLEHVRLNLNAFVDKRLVSFDPYKDEDGARWRSGDPVGSVLLLDIYVADNDVVRAIDKACLVCSIKTARLWRFSTIRAGTGWTAVNNPDNPGAHPVSGNREFGYFQGPGAAHTFYTIGADRATRPVDEFFGVRGVDETGFNIADSLWKSFQAALVRFVNDHGGRAEAAEPTVTRPQWDQVKGDKNLYDTAAESQWFSRTDLGL